MDRQQLLTKIDKAWSALLACFAGLTDAQMTQPGVTGDWSVKDILAHVTDWEEEALKHLPHIVAGKRPPKYADLYGGIDAFNALKSRENAGRTLEEVLARLHDTHARFVAYAERAPEELLAGETRFRRRLRLDTYSHYPIHTRAIAAWRAEQGF